MVSEIVAVQLDRLFIRYYFMVLKKKKKINKKNKFKKK